MKFLNMNYLTDSVWCFSLDLCKVMQLAKLISQLAPMLNKSSLFSVSCMTLKPTLSKGLSRKKNLNMNYQYGV